MTSTGENSKRKALFWACFMALMATSFIFMLRAMLISTWGLEFNLTKTEMGEILGVGLWPFALSIVLFSLIVDSIGYGRAMVFAFLCHVSSVILILFAKGYWMLYVGTFIMALGNGTVEAVINPMVATLFPNEKSKWLNILHAGWPGGMVLAGIIAIFMGPEISWQFKMSLVFIPTIIYGIMMIRLKFPTSERVAAGISYIDMLKEVGVIGALIIVSLMVFQVGGIFNFSTTASLIIVGILIGIYGYFVRSWGKPLFIILLLIVIPLATTELATDSWLPELMAPELEKIGIDAAWILVYTAIVMTIMRFSAGPFVKKLKPLGLLALSSAIAAIGLFFLSAAVGFVILIAATIYGMAKAFLYPTMIGIVGERFPKGGALTMNLMIGVGLIGSGILGAPMFGYIQDTSIEKGLKQYDVEHGSAYYQTYITEPKSSIFGEYKALNQEKLSDAPKEEQDNIDKLQKLIKKGALKKIAILPLMMFIAYLLLIFYFKRKGGYKPLDLSES
jgi:MFS family permease